MLGACRVESNASGQPGRLEAQRIEGDGAGPARGARGGEKEGNQGEARLHRGITDRGK